jgi:serine/threonine-protein kinase RsbW
MFEIVRNTNRLDITFPSLIENIETVNEETRNFLSGNGMDSYLFNILLIMREALTNAVIHGNKHDPDKIVHYGIRFAKGCLVMKVEDQGEGFDWKQQLTGNPYTTADSGRGLVIMNKYATAFRFNGKGNRLVVVWMRNRERQ